MVSWHYSRQPGFSWDVRGAKGAGQLPHCHVLTPFQLQVTIQHQTVSKEKRVFRLFSNHSHKKKWPWTRWSPTKAQRPLGCPPWSEPPKKALRTEARPLSTSGFEKVHRYEKKAQIQRLCLRLTPNKQQVLLKPSDPGALPAGKLRSRPPAYPAPTACMAFMRWCRIDRWQSLWHKKDGWTPNYSLPSPLSILFCSWEAINSPPPPPWRSPRAWCFLERRISLGRLGFYRNSARICLSTLLSPAMSRFQQQKLSHISCRDLYLLCIKQVWQLLNQNWSYLFCWFVC